MLALRPPISLDSSNLIKSPTCDPLEGAPRPREGRVSGLVGLIPGLAWTLNLLSTAKGASWVGGCVDGVTEGVRSGGREDSTDWRMGKPGREVKVTGIG